MRFATCLMENRPVLVCQAHDGLRALAGCADYLDWLRLDETDRQRALQQAQPVKPLAFLSPILQPPSLRDFYAFEAHVQNARRQRGLEMLKEWYEVPVFYFSNPACLIGHEQPVSKPPDTERLDYELEWAVIIGKEGGNWTIPEAESAIAGFTIMNDWSARDIQRLEMKIGLGPAKGKDFATSLGPWIVTPDELESYRLPNAERGSHWRLKMTAKVNGQIISEGSAETMNWTFAELIAHASRNTRLSIGDVIGSGTVGTGCLLEFPAETYPWLQPGDEVELEVEGLGALKNRIV